MGVSLPPEEARPQDFEVLPENWETAQIFIACQTQWREVGDMNPRRSGLDYTAVSSVIQMWGVEDARPVFDGVRVMEATVLAVWSRRKPV